MSPPSPPRSSAPFVALPGPLPLNNPSDLGVISKFADDAIDSVDDIMNVIDEDNEEGGAQHRALRNARLDSSPL